MNTDQINYLNIGLMALSAIIAVFLPFELFLFSYVILGPLHYLTELSWLHKRRYFSPGKYDFWILGALCLLILLPTVIRQYLQLTHAGTAESSPSYAATFQVGRVMMFVAFAAAAVLVFVRSAVQRAIAIAVIIVIGFIFRSQQFVVVLFALFVPTIIHVFVFTGAFIFVGALKSRSLSGLLSLVVFIACAVCLLFVNIHPGAHAGTTAVAAYDAGSFLKVNQQIFATFLHRHVAHDDVYFSSAGVLIMRFIAFAYTYHYLNWFSKTSIIKWHQVPLRSLITVLLVWVLSVGLYFTNYLTGVAFLYFLSIVHVIFEFPLNFQSLRDIGKEIGKLTQGGLSGH